MKISSQIKRKSLLCHAHERLLIGFLAIFSCKNQENSGIDSEYAGIYFVGVDHLYSRFSRFDLNIDLHNEKQFVVSFTFLQLRTTVSLVLHRLPHPQKEAQNALLRLPLLALMYDLKHLLRAALPAASRHRIGHPRQRPPYCIL